MLVDSAPVFRFFQILSTIPRGSGHCGKIAQYCVSFAKERGLTYQIDHADNVLIKKPAAPGYEGKEPILIQGHLDMVCEKEIGLEFDFLNDSLNLYSEGDYLKAKGTTLGADDGIAVAIMLALLDGSYPAPALECLFTTDEEIGMLGASELDGSWFQAKKLINIDSEAEGVFTIGCAGGNRTLCSIPVFRREDTLLPVTIMVHQGLGGHSGIEIHKNRANAICILGKCLKELYEKVPFSLLSIEGGFQDNVIPSAATARIAGVSQEEANQIIDYFDCFIRSGYRETDPHLSVAVSPAEHAEKLGMMDSDSTCRVLQWLAEAPNGVQAMCTGVPDLVETSLNLGMVRTSENEVCFTYCVRSSVNSKKAELTDRLIQLAEHLHGIGKNYGDYSAWEKVDNSPLQSHMRSVFEEIYQKEPVIDVVHAGLECGIIAEKIPHLDAVSIGPTIKDIHTPKEALSISSTENVWNYIILLLRLWK